LDADYPNTGVLIPRLSTSDGAEGLSGLARAFFFAGAKALMVSHWPVEDKSAMALMTETMKRSATGNVSRAQALREAMLAVMNDSDHDWGHPLFWAPFVVVGESRQ
jgi:CHAT domain-containing protein